jgi:hypothetical protein
MKGQLSIDGLILDSLARDSILGSALLQDNITTTGTIPFILTIEDDPKEEKSDLFLLNISIADLQDDTSLILSYSTETQMDQ